MLEFEQLDPNRFNWDETIGKFPDRTIFQSSAWLAFVAGTQNAEPITAALKDGSSTVGYFTGLIVRKFGLRILGSPFPGWTTQYMGFNLSAGISRRAAVEALTRFAFGDLKCVHLECVDPHLTVEDAQALGMDYKLCSSFEIDLRKSEDELYKNMDNKSIRWCIRKAEKCGVTIEEGGDEKFADEYYEQLKDVFAKQSLLPTYGPERVHALIRNLSSTGALLLLRARDSTGRCIGTHISVGSNDRAVLWGTASFRPDQYLCPNQPMWWHAIKYWKAQGVQFYDLGGKGDYKKKYGAYATQYAWLRQSRYPLLSFLRNLTQDAFKVRQRVLGWRTARRANATLSQERLS
jgi:CelD/BcsL family acetyltransferase involved in cellulose biosynthesis